MSKLLRKNSVVPIVIVILSVMTLIFHTSTVTAEVLYNVKIEGRYVYVNDNYDAGSGKGEFRIRACLVLDGSWTKKYNGIKRALYGGGVSTTTETLLEGLQMDGNDQILLQLYEQDPGWDDGICPGIYNNDVTRYYLVNFPGVGTHTYHLWSYYENGQGQACSFKVRITISTV
ncbi:MAG: hypothetical protein ACFFC7_12535 [Candidatus Hermodarchaeota archaeon]